MRNLKLTIAYDGAAYAGFQRQAHLPTVQAALEEALAALTGGRLHVTGAGRTDAGVHALGQVVNFRTLASIPTQRFVPALNSLLPRDIAVLDAAEVPLEFHARFWAKAKTYTYRIWRAPVRPVFERDRVYHFTRPLDLTAIAEATRLLHGTHDFASLCGSGSEVRSTTRTVREASWAEADGILSFCITADGFLYHMVRNLVGTLILVGLGKHPPSWVDEILAGRDRTLAGPTVPAAGLFLVSVEY